MSELILSVDRINKGYRIAVSGLFFLQGLCFATWASRIPSIQQNLLLSDASLGLVLFALPLGSIIGLPFSAWLVTRFGSKRIASNALLLYSVFLLAIGLSQNIIVLVVSLLFYGMAGNISNIAINTQAVGVEAKYNRNIMASFHGLWSLAGFIAAGIGTLMMGNAIGPLYHFVIVCIVIVGGLAASFNFLLPDEDPSNIKQKLFVKPNKTLLKLGVIAFCCMMVEGAMFDWSGVYFQKIVEAPKVWIGVGYTAFMLTMTTGRFFADWAVGRLGFNRTIQLSGVLITAGLGTSIMFPYLIPSTIGFLIVGFGVSSVVPLVFSRAGQSNKQAPGIALATVSSIAFLGFLAGPPIIGVIAGLFSLRISFILIAIIGIAIIAITSLPKVLTKNSH